MRLYHQRVLVPLLRLPALLPPYDLHPLPALLRLCELLLLPRRGHVHGRRPQANAETRERDADRHDTDHDPRWHRAEALTAQARGCKWSARARRGGGGSAQSCAYGCCAGFVAADARNTRTRPESSARACRLSRLPSPRDRPHADPCETVCEASPAWDLDAAGRRRARSAHALLDLRWAHASPPPPTGTRLVAGLVLAAGA